MAWRVRAKDLVVAAILCGSHDPRIDERASALGRNNGTLHGHLSAAANPVDRAVASLAGTSSVAVKTLRLGDVVNDRVRVQGAPER